MILVVVSAISQIWQFLLRLSKLVVVFLFIGVNSFDLISASNFDLGAVATHVIRMLAIL